MSDKHLSELNAQQRAAVTYGIKAGSSKLPGPLLVLAGAGTGKTKTLAHRATYCVVHGADPQRILLLVFGRVAAKEMQSRTKAAISRATGSTGKEIKWAGTFHSIGARIVRLYANRIGLKTNFTVLDSSDAAGLMSMVGHSVGTKVKPPLPNKDDCSKIYSRMINTQKGLARVLTSYYPQFIESKSLLSELFRAYKKAKRAQNVVDYDDLLKFWLELLNDKKVGDRIRGLFDHVLVDEYQDTNRLQAKILKKLKPDGRGLTVVGDDAQSIYSFRGARVRNILGFPDSFTPKAHVIKLEQNYRSTQPILAACNAAIGLAAKGYRKKLWSNRKSNKRPGLIRVLNEVDQARYVVDEIDKSRKAGIPLCEQAVLFRTSEESVDVEHELIRRKIPFRKYGGPNFFESRHVKDVISILRWCENPKDRVAGFRTLQLLPGIGPASANNILDGLSGQLNRKAFAKAVVPKKARKEWSRFMRLFHFLCRKDGQWPGDLFAVRKWYDQNLSRRYDRADQRSSDLDQLENIAARHGTRQEFLTELTLDPSESSRPEENESEDYVVLSTIHSAKGREWWAVRIINAVKGCIPYGRAETAKAQEEERRMFHVAMSRAIDKLDILVPRRAYLRRSGGQGHMQVMLSRTRFIPKSIVSKFDQRAWPKVKKRPSVAQNGISYCRRP
jgi:DNA helicase II / ATP-dependent DNA helicase PcrA